MCAWMDCDRVTVARGVCQSHYDKTLRIGLRVATGGRPTWARETSVSIGERLAELEWLLDGGVTPDTAAARIGWARDTAIRYARVHGRPDIAEKYLRRLPATVSWEVAA